MRSAGTAPNRQPSGPVDRSTPTTTRHRGSNVDTATTADSDRNCDFVSVKYGLL